MRGRLLAALTVVLGIGAGVGVAAASSPADGVAAASSPAAAPPDTASFTAVDFAWNVSGSTSTQANIAPGGTVTFSYPSGGYHHNADFGAGPQPTSCAQTAGANSGAVPPLPHQPTAAGWSGTCTFDTAGTYTFHCDMHPFMTATIVVGDATTTTTSSTAGTTSTATSQTTTVPTTTTTTTTTSTSTTTTSKPPVRRPPASPLAGDATHAITLGAVQHGPTVHGSLRISAAGQGGRATIALFAAGHRRVGGPVHRHLSTGFVRFAVPLRRAAHRTLRRKGHLDVTVTVVVTAPGGARVAVSRRVRLRA